MQAFTWLIFMILHEIGADTNRLNFTILHKIDADINWLNFILQKRLDRHLRVFEH